MTTLPPPPMAYQPPPPYDQDTANLQTLSIFYFIIAGLQALIGFIPMIYVLFGALIGIAGVANANGAGDAGAAAGLGGIMVCFGIAFSLLIWIFAFLDYKVARGLRARRNITLCYVMAAIHCLSIPLGTILGVFTFVVLARPSVKASFTWFNDLMNTMPLAITRCALLTPFDEPCAGGGWTGTWEALCAGRHLESRVAVDDRLLAGPDTLDRSIRMALAVARAVLHPSTIENQKSKIENPPLALFCATSKGPVSTMLDALARVRRNQPLPAEQARHVMLGTGAMGAFLADELGLRGPVHTSVAACASGMFALHRAAEAVRRGQCARALVVAADASLHPLFAASFARLGVLAPADAGGVRRCEPFGEGGRGFFISEAAAALLLEPAGDSPAALLENTWIGGDGTSLLAVDPHAATLREGLRRLADPVATLAFVQAHATGTAHDRHELAALRAVLPALPPECIFSHKGQLGHSLGAAGLVSVALSVMAHQHGCTHARTDVPRGASSLTLAQGFGGHVGLARLRGM